ncbi:MAG: pilus assembly protein PilM [Candidatus Eremiobacteraeota bacterium]|nr:pilus assembly protein PilM [Candidatus Eremiobacteraeota bacterium]
MDGLRSGSILHGAYRIVETAKKKSWSFHYRAESLSGDEKYYLKEFLEPPSADPDELALLMEKFEAFIRRFISLAHPRIMKVIDYFRDSERYYVVLENVAGITLQQKAFSWDSLGEEIARFASDLCDTLLYIEHLQKSLEIRSLSPDNILISADLSFKLIDLGIGSFFLPFDRKKVIVKPPGAPGFAAPEEYGSRKVDRKSDIYSFGAILYFLFTRQRPPESSDLLLGNEVLVPPTHLRKNINPEIEKVIMKAMALDRGERYESFSDIQKGLKSASLETWSSAHTHPMEKARDLKKQGPDIEDLPEIEPYAAEEEWIINRFRKDDIGITSPIGIDVGSDSIKLTAIDMQKDGNNIALVAKVPTPAGTVSEGVIEKPAELAQYLRDWLEMKGLPLVHTARHGFFEKLAVSTGLSKRCCVVMTGGTKLFVRGMEMDTSDPHDIKFLAQLQISDNLPIKIEQAKCETVLVTHEKKKNRILFFALSREILDKTREFANALNFNLVSTEFEPFALKRALPLILGSDTLYKTLALLNIGAEYSFLAFYGKGSIRHSRILPFGGRAITRKLAESLELPPEKAENVKRIYAAIGNDGARDFPSPLSESLFTFIEPLLKDLARELNKTFSYYSSVNENRKVELLILTGGGASLKNLDRYLHHEVGVSVVTGNVFRNLLWSSILEGNTKALEKEFTSFSVSMGLSFGEYHMSYRK